MGPSDDLTTRSHDTPMRWGIAATGGIAASMTQALAVLPDAEVVAVGSRTADAAARFAEQHGIGRAHGSYADLFADDDVDIVYVASPHSHHHAMTIAALDAGKHVLCEKAFAINAGQAREMVEAAQRNGRFLMEAMWTWFIPAVVELRRLVRDGAIGELKIVEANFGIPVHDPDGRHRRIDLAGGALLDLGIYPISFGRYLAGDPIEARVLGSLGDTGVDATVGGVVAYAGGALGVFHTSLDMLSGNGASAVGTTGRIDVAAPFWFPTRLTLVASGAEPVEMTFPHHGLAHEAAHAMDRIRGGHLESDVIPLSTTVSTMELLDDIRAQLGVVYPEELPTPSAG
jgi:predicted dehydrogenase